MEKLSGSEAHIQQQVVNHRLKHGLCHQCGSSIFSLGIDGTYGTPRNIPDLVENGRCLFCYPNRSTNETTQRSPAATRSLNPDSWRSPSKPLERGDTSHVVTIKAEPTIAFMSASQLETPDASRKRKAVDDDDEDYKKPPARSTIIIVTDADGVEFTGTVSQGNFQHGKGCFTHLHTKGDRKGKTIVYEGEIMHGKFHGQGTCRDYATGCTYEGTFCHGAAHGYGKCAWAQGWAYEGEWYVDKRHGKGVCRQVVDGGEVYDGEWKNDQWDGHGCLKFAGGGQYDGEFRRDKLHGKGEYHFADSSLYKGFFKEDLREGHGSMVYADSVRYIGEWKNNWRSGKGTLFHSDGSVFKGRFKGDEKDGIGYLHLPDGIVRKERWVDGVLLRN